MYRNYDFGYGGPPPRRRVPVPDFSFREPCFRGGYGGPFMANPWVDVHDPWLDVPDPYMPCPRPMGIRGPYHRPRPSRPRGAKQGATSHFGSRFVNKQIDKTTEKILHKFDASESNKNEADARASSKNSSNASTSEGDKSVITDKESNANPEVKSEAESGYVVQSSQDDTAKEVSQPAVPIGPRIPAKQMWESSYRETVTEKDEAESLTTPPPEESGASASVKNPPASANKRKQKYNKFKRGPYYKRKKKTDANGQSGTDGETVTTYPRMCTTCNVQLTGEEQEKMHNLSEIHINNIKNPSVGVGTTAKISLEKLNETVPLPTNTPDCLRWEPDTGDRTVNTVRFCRLCSVRMTSLQNAKQHYDGKSHAKKIRIVQRGHRPPRKVFKPAQFISGGQLGVEKQVITGAYSYSQAFIQAQPQPTMPVINLKPSLPGNFANSMTPSGRYYCQTCKIVIEHAGNLNFHLQSREHKLAKAKS